jgi:5'-nucleotidase
MPATPLILITNDDGIRSPGLLAAARACAPLGELLIAAPVVQQSGVGRAKPSTSGGRILTESLVINGQHYTGYAIEGAPAQVVEHALVELATRPVALAVSGVNYGENIGEGISVSGTVGAAMEAASLAVPSLAVSLQTAPEHYFSHSLEVEFEVAAHFVHYFARAVLAKGLPPSVDLLKIDIPKDAGFDTPWRWTRSSRQRYFHAVAPVRTQLSDPAPMGFRTGFDAARLESDSDIHALVIDGVVAVTPVELDMTAPIPADELATWFSGETTHEQ